MSQGLATRCKTLKSFNLAKRALVHQRAGGAQGVARGSKTLKSFDPKKRAASKIPRFLHQTSTVFLQPSYKDS